MQPTQYFNVANEGLMALYNGKVYRVGEESRLSPDAFKNAVKVAGTGGGQSQLAAQLGNGITAANADLPDEAYGTPTQQVQPNATFNPFSTSSGQTNAQGNLTNPQQTAALQAGMGVIQPSSSPLYGLAPNAPQTPTIPPPPNTNNINNSTIPSSGDVSPYFQQYQSLLNLSPEEQAAQTKLNQLDASKNQSFVDLEGQPIALPFITGQQAAVQKSADLSKIPLQNQLALAQARRKTALDAASAGLDYAKYQEDNAFRKQQLAQNQTQFQASLDVDKQKAGVTGNEGVELSPGSTYYTPSTGATYTAPALPKSTTSTSTSSTSTSTGSTSLDIGASGENVTSLQNWLISQGYSIPAIQNKTATPGYYGAQTQAAVAKFQKDHNVDTSGGGIGTFGPRTQAAATQLGFSIQNPGTTPFTASEKKKLEAAGLLNATRQKQLEYLYGGDRSA